MRRIINDILFLLTLWLRWWNKPNVLTLVLVLALVLPLGAQSLLPPNFQTGIWHKIAITRSGVHKITAEQLAQIGISPSSYSHIQLWGSTGAQLSQQVPSEITSPLSEHAIFILETTGTNAAIYFYAEGPETVTILPESKQLTHQVNPYTDSTYYFITVGAVPGKRITQPILQNTTPDTTIRTAQQYWHLEKERINLLRSGRKWLGDYFNNTTPMTIELPTLGIVPNSTLHTQIQAAVTSNSPSSLLSLHINQTEIIKETVVPVNSGVYAQRASEVNGKGNYTWPASNTPTLRLQIGLTGTSNLYGYLDYISLQSERYLQAYSEGTHLYFPHSQHRYSEYVFTNTPSSYQVWDISNLSNVVALPVSSSLNNEKSYFGNAKVLYGFNINEVPNITTIKRVAPQNIRNQSSPNLLIISGPTFRSEAERLAQYRRENDGLDVLVVTPEEVYNEFSAGKPDVSAIRNLCAHYYQQAPEHFKYLLLFGDATYDYRNKATNLPAIDFHNLIPTYQSYESLHPVHTYASDDYFGFLETGQGEWKETPTDEHLLTIGIGRIPIKSVVEARNVVDKLIAYNALETFGKWRNTITFVADDGDYHIHEEHANALASTADPKFVTQKLFVDTYPQRPVGMTTAPEIKAGIRKAIDQGSLVLNFTGHGDISGWTDEKILTLNDIQELKGYQNMPLIVTATCEFGRYDDPALVSGAELMVLHSAGAAIGALTTTRPVYASTNFTLNQAFYKALINPTQSKRLGDLMRTTKNESIAGVLNRNFVLLGDPTLILAVPEQTIQWNALPDTVRSLEKTSLTGYIQSVSGKVDSTFNGSIRFTIFDNLETIPTLTPPVANYSARQGILFEGIARVQKGHFLLECILPNGISKKGNILVSGYALDSTSLTQANTQLIVPFANTVHTLPPSTTPIITTAFTTTPYSLLKIYVKDEYGINFTNNCPLELVINDTLHIPLEDYFVSQIDSYQEFEAIVNLTNLPAGTYNGIVSVCNLSGIQTTTPKFEFEITNTANFIIKENIVFPNPIVTNQLFYRFKHNKATHDLELNIKVWDITGKLWHNSQEVIFKSEADIESDIYLNLPRFGTINQAQIYIIEFTLRSLQDLTTTKWNKKIIRR